MKAPAFCSAVRRDCPCGELLRVLAILLLAENLSCFLCLLHFEGLYGDPANPFHPVGEVGFVQILYNIKGNFHFRKSQGLGFIS